MVLKVLTIILIAMWAIDSAAGQGPAHRSRARTPRDEPSMVQRSAKMQRLADVQRPADIQRQVPASTPTEQAAGRLSDPGPRPDLFVADPDTYAPRYDRVTRPPGGRGWVANPPALAGTLLVPVFAPLAVGGVPGSALEAYEPDERPAPRPPPTAPSVHQPAPYVPVNAGAAPRTFYVIPRCYAGDAPPQADQLPAGCNIQDVRTVAPAVRGAARERP